MNCKFKFHLRAALHRGAAGPVAPPMWMGRPAFPMRRYRTWWALPGRLGSANGRDAFYCFARPSGSRSKTEFFGFAGRRARTAPAGGLLFPDFQVYGSRSKTEFFGFAGRCARTVPGGGLLFPDFQVCGSRSKTEFFGFAGRRARTAPAGGLRSDERDARKAPPVSVHLFPLLYFQKERIDDELTLSPRRRQF